AKERDYGAALIAAWRVVELSRGDAELEAEALLNVGQLMSEAGHNELARDSFSAVIASDAPARLLLPALSGLALSSARLREEPTLEWSVREVWRSRTLPVPKYELAAALLECAIAAALLDRHDESDSYRKASLDVATSHAFHELVYR